jgi:hypothetical protein
LGWVRSERSSSCDRAGGRQVGVAGAIALVAVWELTIPPSNTGDWQPKVAEMPYAEIDGDRVVIHNFRNFDYFSKTDFHPQWETKTVQLSNLRTVDFFTNFWGPKLICHTFVSFDSGPAGYVCISIETRTKKNQGYSAIAVLYRQYELYYVIGDERDIVRLRTNYRLEDVYLYHLIPATPERSRALFLDYVKSANELHERARPCQAHRLGAAVGLATPCKRLYRGTPLRTRGDRHVAALCRTQAP